MGATLEGGCERDKEGCERVDIVQYPVVTFTVDVRCWRRDWRFRMACEAGLVAKRGLGLAEPSRIPERPSAFTRHNSRWRRPGGSRTVDTKLDKWGGRRAVDTPYLASS